MTDDHLRGRNWMPVTRQPKLTRLTCLTTSASSQISLISEVLLDSEIGQSPGDSYLENGQGEVKLPNRMKAKVTSSFPPCGKRGGRE